MAPPEIPKVRAPEVAVVESILSPKIKTKSFVFAVMVVSEVGNTPTIEGAEVSAELPVVKVAMYVPGMAIPCALFTPVPTVMVYWVLAVKLPSVLAVKTFLPVEVLNENAESVSPPESVMLVEVKVVVSIAA